MEATASLATAIPWWKEPTKDEWIAYRAAWLGGTLDAFDVTIFLLMMVPVAAEFHAPLTGVAVLFAITLWMRLVGSGCPMSGWKTASCSLVSSVKCGLPW